MITAPTKRLLSTKEAAAYCGVCEATFKTHLRITPVKIGTSVRYDVRAIDKWLDGKAQSSPVTGDQWLGKLDEDHSEGA